MMSPAFFIICIVMTCALFIYIFNGLIQARIRKRVASNNIPMAINIFKAIVFICVGLLMQPVTRSFLLYKEVVSAQPEVENKLIFYLATLGMYGTISALVLIIILWLSSNMFFLVNNKKLMVNELCENNLNAAVIGGGIVLALTLTSIESLPQLFDIFIPYQEVLRIN